MMLKTKTNTTLLVLIVQYCISVEAGSLIRIVKTVTLSNFKLWHFKIEATGFRRAFIIDFDVTGQSYS
jgi:hypothetical protein